MGALLGILTSHWQVFCRHPNSTTSDNQFSDEIIRAFNVRKNPSNDEFILFFIRETQSFVRVGQLRSIFVATIAAFVTGDPVVIGTDTRIRE